MSEDLDDYDDSNSPLFSGPLSPTGESSSRVFKRSARYKDAASALGRRVRHLRKERGWTLDTASTHMRIDLKHLQKIEAGGLNVTLVTLARIAGGFRLPIEMLFRSDVDAAGTDAAVFDFVKKKLESGR